LRTNIFGASQALCTATFIQEQNYIVSGMVVPIPINSPLFYSLKASFLTAGLLLLAFVINFYLLST